MTLTERRDAPELDGLERISPSRPCRASYAGARCVMRYPRVTGNKVSVVYGLW
jgi:hypothetical protein